MAVYLLTMQDAKLPIYVGWSHNFDEWQFLMEMLLRAGADISANTLKSVTPLLCAISKGAGYRRVPRGTWGASYAEPPSCAL